MDKINNKKSGETFKERVADKVDNAATKIADKVHEKAEQFKGGAADTSNRSGLNGTKKPSENCGCSASDKTDTVSGDKKPGQGNTY